MEGFWKAAAMIVLTVILAAAIGKREKDIAVVLTTFVCCVTAIISIGYLEKTVSLLWSLGNTLGNMKPFLGTLLKIVGVSLMTELIGLISTDAGSNTLGKAMQILGNAVILSLSVPMLEAFLSVIQEMLRI